MKFRLWPKSLLGQMLFAVAAALLVAQAISAVLLVLAQDQRRETGAANGLVFQLVAEPRFDYRDRQARGSKDRSKQHWQRFRIERTAVAPLHPGETRDAKREELVRSILTEQGIEPAQLIVTHRKIADDPYVMTQRRAQDRIGPWSPQSEVIVAGMLRKGESEWSVARVPRPGANPQTLGGIIGQTLLLYVLLVGGLALLLRRITRPLRALTIRMERFSRTRETEGQLMPSGPEDTRRLIDAHNQMEGRIAALLDEKDVMLGAIGHDLKTPLAALRVRIESVDDDRERDKMAASIEDITRTLDDILSLARVGRPSDHAESTDLSALTATVVEEFEDMGDDVAFEDAPRVALKLRATWLRRALRNLIANALRYGGGAARVSLASRDGHAVLRIEDDGPGIPDGEIDAMLQPFRRGEGSRSRETGGAGLGLTLARAIAEQHGGSLVIANRLREDGTVAGLVAELRIPLD
ncbi:MAG: ATP-binding protein [Candidatus Andeanibacterium colombiense]|uniref:histidine kinase n=1 Tax=Candidatus Andeanibacterium colombiense TaxID=3121345 RepID=A0AAJ6BN52_9SPHN|nr:MAG: ATP-binding protein [Sphingomonadaceae bacterium]